MLAFFATRSSAATDFSLWGTDVSLSGYGTAGFAISDQDFNYQRFLNDRGTFLRDSVFGLQIDAKLNHAFSVTVQGKLMASSESDKQIEPTAAWAFLSWRPSDEWLFRGGRLRIPYYLNSETTNIGTTFDFARLPVEIYSISAAADIDGLFASKTWALSSGELTLDGYVGAFHTDYRVVPYDQPPLSAATNFWQINTKGYGFALTFQHEDDTLRIGFHDSFSRRADGQAMDASFPYVPIMPGVGYYQVSDELPGPGVTKVNEARTLSYIFGAAVEVPYGFRVMLEYLRRDVRDLATGPDSQGGYLALLRPIGQWTPYISVAHLQSMSRSLRLYNGLAHNVVPDFIPDATLLNAAQRAAAVSIDTYDQTTWALGASYRLNPVSKLKMEWAITQTGDVSGFIDTPVGGLSGNRVINVFSFSYNVVF